MNMSSSIFRCLCVSTMIVFSGTIALFVFVVIPLREKIAAGSDEIQKFHAKTENAERKIAKLPEIEAQFGIVKEDERKISQLLSEAKVVDFIKEVEVTARGIGGEVSIAQGSAIEVQKKKTSTKKEKESEESAAPKSIAESLPWEKQLPLQIAFSGEYAKMVNFLHKIETMSYRLDVLSIDIRPIVPEEGRRLGGDVFAPTPSDGSSEIPTEGAAPVIVVEPEKPSVAATFNIVVYMEE